MSVATVQRERERARERERERERERASELGIVPKEKHFANQILLSLGFAWGHNGSFCWPAPRQLFPALARLGLD